MAVGVRDDLERLTILEQRAKGQHSAVSKTRIADAIADMGFAPDRYSSKYENLTGLRRHVFRGLAEAIGEPFRTRDRSGEAFYEKCRKISAALRVWAEELPEMVCELDALTTEEKAFVRRIRQGVPPSLYELAELAIAMFTTDEYVKDELAEKVDGDSGAFPELARFWLRIREVIDTEVMEAKAGVQKEFVAITESLGAPIEQIAAGLVASDETSGSVIQEIARKKPTDAEELVAAVARKPVEALKKEDYKAAQSVLSIFRECVPERGLVRLTALGKALVLNPPVGKDHEELTVAITATQKELELSAAQMASICLSIVLPELWQAAGCEGQEQQETEV